MKHLAIVLFLIFMSCKNEPKTKTEIQTKIDTENGIDKSVHAMWNNFTESNPEFKKDELPDTEFYDDDEKEAERFAELIINKKKQTSSGLYIWYKEANIDLPKIGTKRIVTNLNGEARAIIEIKKVDTIPFNQITKDYAELDMGTDIKPLEKWKKAHWEFFENTLDENGQKVTDEVLVVREWFETIWSKKY